MEPTRRGLLTAAGTVGAAALAGCSSVGGGAAAQEGDSGAVLAFVRVVNQDDTAHTVHVLVERSSDLVHWSTHDLGTGDSGDGRQQLSGSWTESPATYTIHVRLDDADDWETFDVGDRGVPCYGVEARVDEEGTVSLWYRENASDCGGGGGESTATDE
jgi:hypothetical protein